MAWSSVFTEALKLLEPGWMDELPIVLLGIRFRWKEDLDAASALLTYCTNLRMPGDFSRQPRPKEFHQAAFLFVIYKKTFASYRRLLWFIMVQRKHTYHEISCQRNRFTCAMMHIVVPWLDAMTDLSRFYVDLINMTFYEIISPHKYHKIDSNLPILPTLSFLPRPCSLTPRLRILTPRLHE